MRTANKGWFFNLKVKHGTNNSLGQWFLNFFGSRRTVKHIKNFWRTTCTKLKIY
jgi:hypothetical protein